MAIQFDIYCPEPWDLTGQLEISLQNNLANYGWGSAATKYSDEYTNTATVWVPWLNEKDGSHAPFTTGDRWQTITIPMTAFGNYDPEKAADVTFQKIVEDRNRGTYKNLVLFLVNSDLEFSDAHQVQGKYLQPEDLCRQPPCCQHQVYCGKGLQ